MSTELIRLRNAARQLGICPHTLRALVHAGHIRAVRIGVRWFAFEPQELQRYIESRRIEMQPSTTGLAA